MKISKSQLREIIEDELRKDALQEDYEEEEGEEEDIEVEEEKEYVLDPDAPIDELWKQLNFLLREWTKRSPDTDAGLYYRDLLNTVKDFSVGGHYASEEEEIPHLQAEVPGIQERTGLEQSIEEMVREMFQGDLEERKKKRSVKSERRTRGRSARQK